MISSSFISSVSLSDETRRSIARLQSQLVDAQKEIATGRHADVGVTLGATTGVSVSMRQDMDQIQAIQDSNTLVLNRIDSSQTALKTVADSTSTFLSALITGQSASTSPDTLVQAAKAGLQTLQDQLNTSVDGQFLFSGINSDVKPIDDFFGSPPSQGATAVANAFKTVFGFLPDDPQAANITPAQMQGFLNSTTFTDLFTATGWTTNWSHASDKPVSNRISRTGVADTSVTANDSNFRNLTEAYAMIAGLGYASLNSGAQQVLLSNARTITANVTGGLTQVQSTLGVTQQRISDANDQITAQVGFLTKSIDNLETIDTASVTTQLSQISTALQAAYSLTNQLNKLTLMDYLTA